MLMKFFANLFERTRSKIFKNSSNSSHRSSLSNLKKFSSIERSQSWRSLKERRTDTVRIRTLSVDELHRSRRKRSNFRFDRLAPNMVKYQEYSQRSIRHHTDSTGTDSGYSDEIDPIRSSRARPWHTSCPHCHCEQRSSFKNYQKPNENRISSNLLPSRSYPHLQSLNVRRRRRERNLSCDSSLWKRIEQSKPINVIQPIFGELNVAAIELDSLRHSISSSSSTSSSSSSSLSSETTKFSSIHQKGLCLVWQDYQSSSVLSNGGHRRGIFSVKRGDQVRLLKPIGKSTYLVQKEDDGNIGFLPQTSLTHHQINSFLSLKGLRETVL